MQFSRIRPWVISLSLAAGFHGALAILEILEARATLAPAKETVIPITLVERVPPPPPEPIEPPPEIVEPPPLEEPPPVVNSEPPPPAPVPPPEPVKPEPPKKKRVAKKPEPPKKKKVPEKAEPTPPPVAQPELTEAPLVDPPPAVEPPEPKAPVVADATPVPNARPATPRGNGANMRGYWSETSRRIMRKKHYPRVARRRGLEGRVVLGVTIGRDGALAAEPKVLRSSECSVLDAEAVRMVQAAAPFQPLPTEFERKVLKKKLTINFELEDS